MKLVETDSETLQWFPTHMRWNSNDEREEWAELCALALLSAHEKRPKRRRIKAVRQQLDSFAEVLSGLAPADQTFLFIPLPDDVPVPAFILMAECEGDRESTLRQIVQADAESVVRPVEVESFATERLSEGIRSTRYWSTPDGQLMVTVRYGWRVEASGVDLCFYMVWDDPGKMAFYTDIVDEFTRSLWVSDTE
ncbi:hypothetical protein [Streptomyces hirsutus]|uniref:hypothetical protein n=1 Tax=Streptomyces hirsutus TaxID=35620 RepID=UPI0006E40474|nr:hypothetical protein [Streptomyces hirsutus]